VTDVVAAIRPLSLDRSRANAAIVVPLSCGQLSDIALAFGINVMDGPDGYGIYLTYAENDEF
jgi:hypothetical protein